MADSTKSIEKEQGYDRSGKVVVNATDAVKVVGSATTEIEATAGTNLYMVGLTVYVPTGSGTFHFTDADDDPITGLPDVTNKAGTDYAGTYPFFRFKVINGLKIVTASSGTFVATMFYSKV